MNRTQICLLCGYENDIDNLECAQCGASLKMDDPTPIMVDPMDEAVIDATRNKFIETPISSGVALFIAGRKEPLVITQTGTFILGRNASAQDRFKIDLNKYQGHSLGVSRQHATLTITDKTCTLEDLDSTNGTWINDEQLVANKPHPVQSGDIIRLGYLLIIMSFDK